MKLLSKRFTLFLFFLVAQIKTGTSTHGKIRFEKFNFTTPGTRNITFPISRADALFLRENSNSTSVVLPSDDCVGISFTELKNNLEAKGLYPPPHPDDTPVKFWNRFKEVMKAVIAVKNFQNSGYEDDPLRTIMPRITHLWKGNFDIIDVADAVHDEFPGVYHRQMIAEWLDNKSLKRKRMLFPQLNLRDFLRFEIFLSDMVGHAIRMVSPCVFALKWEVGNARPEEVAWKIVNGELEVPEGQIDSVWGLLDQIDFETFDSATEFTAYYDGSPTHPSYPAMHSAASAASFWLDVTMDLTDEQRCQARMLDYSIAYARTVAGVHYSSDNLAGLMAGQEILAQRLPRYLQEEYGADYSAAKDAVEAARFDWTLFRQSDCWTNCAYVQFMTRQLHIDECEATGSLKHSSENLFT